MPTLDLLFDWLLQVSLRASALCLVVLVLQHLLRRHLSARWLHALWLPVLLILLMPMLPESRWSAESLILTAPSHLAASTLEAASTQAGGHPAIQAGRFDTAGWPVWPCVVIGGALALMLGGVISFTLTLRRIQKTAAPPARDLLQAVESLSRELRLRQLPRVWQSSTVASPAVAGIFRPVLLLPLDFAESFTPDEASLILKHELTHLQRGDLLMNSLLCCLMALHWFNPLLWLAFHRVRADREAACDADVLHHDGPGRRHTYGLALLKTQSASGMQGWNLGFVGIFEPAKSLHHRIQAIANPARTHRMVAVGVVVLLTALTGVIATKAEVVKTEEPFIGVEMQIISEVDAAKFFTDTDTFRIMSTSELGQLRKNPKVKTVSWPRLVTKNDQEVEVRSVVNTPVNDPNQPSGITYLPIGCIAKFKPRLLNGRIHLDVDLTNSKIIGYETLKGIDYPIARSHVNSSAIDLAPGETVAVWNKEERTLHAITPSLVDASPAIAAPTALERAQTFRTVQYDFYKADVGDVLNYLAEDSKTLDPNKKGVRIVLPKSQGDRLVGFHLNKPLPEVLQEIASQIDCTLRADEETIFLDPK
ncbi:MAG: M56 family metallopeptidase [Verrucomicrobiota bacterium]